jgi:hypothetical protein
MLVHEQNASQEFRTLFAKFPGMRIAAPEDNAEILAFLESNSMSTGGIRVNFLRGKNYFDLFDRQAEIACAVLLERQGKILGLGALSARHAFVRGRSTMVCYLQDLRLSPSTSREDRVLFFKLISEFVRVSPHLLDFGRCTNFLSAILSGNGNAKHSLSRPQFPLEFTKLMGYQACIWPKVPRALPLQKMLKASQPAHDELLEFYANALGTRAFDLSTDDIIRQLDRAQPVVIREDARIIATCLLTHTNNERSIDVALPHFDIQLPGRLGIYIFAPRVSPKIERRRLQRVRDSLLMKSFFEAQFLDGHFIGMFKLDGEAKLPVPLSLMPHVRVPGELYRVFHADHASQPGFCDGFLRPDHVPGFEWVLS